MTDRNQRGEVRFGLIISIIVLVAVIYFLAQMVPVMYHSYAFEKGVEDIAMQAAGQRVRVGTLDKVRRQILNLADEHGVKEDIIRTAGERRAEPVYIERTGSELIIKVAYVKPVDLVVTTWNWKVDHVERRTLY